MNKKILLIALVIFIGIGLISVSKVVQDKYLKQNNELAKSKDLIEKPIEETLKKDVVADIDSDTIKPIPEIKPETKPETENKTNTDVKEDVKPVEKKTPSTDKLPPIKDAPKEPVKPAPEPKKEPNFLVKDDISGKVILSMYANNDNRTVAQVTFDALDKNDIGYKFTGRSEVVYFTMIAGLKARDAGPLSGWCYYVNGTKSGVSCGAYKLKAGDVVQWKYLKDGVNN